MSTDKTPPEQTQDGPGLRTSFGRVFQSTRTRGQVTLGSRKKAVEGSPPPRPTTKPPVPKTPPNDPPPPPKGPPKDPPPPIPSESPAFLKAVTRFEKERSELDRRLSVIVGETGVDAPDLAKTLSELETSISDAKSMDDLLPCGVALERATQAVEEFARTAKTAGKARTVFEKARQEAESALDEVRSLPGYGICAALTGPGQVIEQALGRAIDHAKAGTEKAWTEAIDLLLDPAGELAKAKTASEKAGPARAAMVQAEVAVNDLSKFRFIDLAPATGPLEEGRTLLRDAASGDEIDQARVKFEAALGAAEFAKTRAEITIQAWGAADRGLKKAEQAILSCQGVDGYGPIVAEAAEILPAVNRTRRDLDVADNHGKVWQAAVTAEELAGRAVEARKLAPQAATALMTLSKARAKVEKVAKLGYVNTSAAMKVVTDAENGVADAADAGAVTRALEPLGTIDDLLEKAKKAAAPAGKEREVWLKARREATDRLSSVLSMPGAANGAGVAADERLVRVIGQMQRILEAADEQAKGCTVEAYKEARKLVAPFEKFTELAQGFSDEAKLALKEDFAAQKVCHLEMLRLERVAIQLEELPGQEQARIALGVLRKAARDALTQVGGLTRGYAAAVKLLTDPATGHAAILAKAKKDEEERTKDARYDDEVLGLHRGVLGLAFTAGETEELVPEVVYRGWRAELRKALESALLTNDLTEEQATKNRNAALERIRAVQKSVEDESDAARPLAKEVRERIDLMDEGFITPLAEVASPGFLESARSEIQRIREVEISAWSWRAAKDRLDTLKEMLVSQAGALTSAKEEWTKLAAELRKRLDDGRPLVEGWQERAGGLVQLRPQIAGLLDETEKSRTWDQGVERGTDLKKEYDSLIDRIRQSLDGQDPNAVALAAKNVRADAMRLIDDAQVQMQKFVEEHLVGIRNVGAVGVVRAVRLVIDRWRGFLAAPKIAKGTTPDEAFQAEFEKLERDLKLAVDVLTKSGKTGFGVSRMQQEGRRADEREDDEARPRVLLSKIELFESRGGDAAPFRKALAEDAPDLKEIERLVDAQLEWIAKTLEVRVAKGRERTGDLAKKVRNAQGSEQTFKSFYETLTQQTEDLQALFESGDPDLIRQAEEEAAALEEKFVRATKPKKDEPTFESVEKAWTKIAKNLGGNVLKRMPDTWRRLSDRSDSDCAKSKTMAPADALVFLEPLLVESARAFEDGEKAAARYEQFKETTKRVKESLEALVGSTATTLSFGKVEAGAFDKRASSRMKAAKELAKTEGKMDDAFLALAGILREIDTIRSSPDPRAELGRVNAEAKQEQEAVISYCRAYEGLRKDFKQFRNQAWTVLKLKGGDESQLTELDRTLEFADKLVSPYRALRSKVPHKRKLANPSPPMDRVIQSFTTASERLKKGIAGARRIARNPKGTSVEVSGDLDGAEAAWRSAAQGFGKIVKALADRIQKAVDEDTTNGPKVEKDVKALLPRLRRISTKFPPQAFTASVSALAEATDKTKAKAAREVVLRDARRTAAAMTKDPLMQVLARRPNPFGVNVAILASELRAALKTLEREALIGV